ALSDKQRHNLSLIVTSGNRLTHLVDDILDFSKLKHHELNLKLTPVDVYTLTDLVILFSRNTVSKSKVLLVNKVDRDIPLVFADENRVQQILYNLIGNAIKFTNEGQITVSSRVWRDNVTICIADTGIGIADDQQKRIFESFEQADGSAARSSGGTGLGLAVTKQLVELHNGTIKVVSCKGKGSEFSFTLPVCEHQPALKEVSEQTHTAKVLAQSLTNQPDVQTEAVLSRVNKPLVKNAKVLSNPGNSAGRILVVDDEPINIQVMQNHLGLDNYQVTAVSNGKDALEAIENDEKFDAVLLDAMMPGMTGYEVCRHIRRIYPANQLPVLMVTAKGGVEDMSASFEAGANDFLTKPVSKTELLERVKTHINVVRLNHDLNQANFQLKKHADALEKKVQQKAAKLVAHGEQLNKANIELAHAT
ncbi:MAG: response regulator, partial [Algicola sp.]|nr:response regulator [Algicola sp.]